MDTARDRRAGRPVGEAGPPGDAELLVRVAGGDIVAFAALYDRVAGPVYGLCRRILRDEHYAEDAALMALMELWCTAPRYDPTRGSPQSWILTLAHRRAVDQVRVLRAAAEREARAAARDYTPHLDTVTDTVLAHAEHHQLRHHIAALTTRQRAAIELVYYQGHTCTGAAALLGIPAGTLKTRLRDALRHLRATLTALEQTPAPSGTSSPPSSHG